MNVRRVWIDEIPFAEHRRAHGIWRRGHWPAGWLAPARWTSGAPLVFACRRRFALAEACTIRAHVSADERYLLFLDGTPIGRGPERGDLNHWYFETYDMALPAGEHTIVALVWALGAASAHAQISAGPGFLFAAEPPHVEQLNTARAEWELRVVEGVSPLHFPGISHDGFTGKKLRLDGRAWPWGVERGEGEGWAPPARVGPASSGYTPERTPSRALLPAALPAMWSRPAPPGRVRFAEVDAAPFDGVDRVACNPARHDPGVAGEVERLLRGTGSLTVPPRKRVRVVIDLDDYYCAYPEVECSGGRDASIRLSWAEALYVEAPGGARGKGHRDVVDHKFFRGFGDEFVCDGGAARIFRPFWWQAGRFVQLHVETADEPLQIRRLRLLETRYPLASEGATAMEGPAWASALPLCRRALETGTHEVLTDSPYYEQLAYVGDARLETLCQLVVDRDDRLPRKTVELIDASRLPDGFVQSRYPCKVVQVIPGYALLWIEMVRDLHFWRPVAGFIRARLAGCRAVLEAFARHVGADGLLSGLPGWVFVDWSPAFAAGEIPGDDPSLNSVANLQYACALQSAAELERSVGIAALADHYAQEARRVVEATRRAFWDSDRNCFADNRSHDRFSEHAQALAVLTGLLTPVEQASCLAALSAEGTTPGFAPSTVYFTHYVIEALRVAGDAHAIARRLAPWAEFARMGLRCTPEEPEPSRSDCHAWSAHPLFHAAATIAGIRPAAPGFAEIEIRPLYPAELRSLRSVVPHPNGQNIEVTLTRQDSGVQVGWRLPDGVPATLVGPDGGRMPLTDSHGSVLWR